MKRSRTPLVAQLVTGVVVLALTCGCAYLVDDWRRAPGRADNPHVIACTANGGTVHEDRQWGGKFYTYSWWCKSSDGQITDIWS
jgi:putative hemolysin